SHRECLSGFAEALAPGILDRVERVREVVERVGKVLIGLLCVRRRLDALQLLRRVAQVVLEVRDVLVERGDVEVPADLRTGVDEVVAEALQLLLVLRLRDGLRLAATTRSNECNGAGRNEERRADHGRRYATRALAGDAQLGNRAGTRAPPRARDARHHAALDEPR